MPAQGAWRSCCQARSVATRQCKAVTCRQRSMHWRWTAGMVACCLRLRDGACRAPAQRDLRCSAAALRVRP
eukprot:15467303-Alexandrium_andersonii.AAC.1